MTRRFALVGITALALAGTAALQAQPPRQGNPDQRPRLEQRAHQRLQGMGAMRGQGMALRGLDLTDAQKEQVKAIHEKTRQEVEAVLTPEQLEKLKARRGGRGGRGGGQ
ncbi:MAG: hypothetical protein FJW21_04020 [Acidimicrobiia bacterium]|nr:hypothetical protein [Acidimicrobiia bacterium]